MDRRYIVVSAALGALWFGACQVYDPSDLTGSGKGGTDSGGGGTSTGGGAGDETGGTSEPSGGDTSAGSGGASGGSGGSAGDEPTGGKGGTSSGGSSTGGKSTGGASTGGAMTGGSSGSSSGGKGGSGGTSAGMAGTATGAGMGGAGGAGGTNAGMGGAGTGGMSPGGMGGVAAGAGGAAAGAGGSGGGGAIVLLTGVASADSSQSGHAPGDGNDGVTTTRWCAANGSTGHYWTLDLGAAHVLSRFEVMLEYPNQAAGLAYGYVISISQDGATFTPSVDHSTNTSTMQTQSSDFPASTSARYVRITVTGLPASTPQPTWASFWEARVYGQ